MVDRLQTEQGRQGHLIDELAAGQAETNYLLNALANALASHFEAQPANKKAAS
jgi:hypothetical protein